MPFILQHKVMFDTRASRIARASDKPVEEKFYDVRITQDDNLALVMFDYEFLVDGKMENYGIESWQLMKTAGKWKIFSVVWSQHPAPK